MTDYNGDGQVNSVYRTDSSLNQRIVQYDYDSAGRVNWVWDGLSNTKQQLTYGDQYSGTARNQVTAVYEDRVDSSGSHLTTL